MVLQACGLEKSSAAGRAVQAWQGPFSKGAGDFARVLAVVCMLPGCVPGCMSGCVPGEWEQLADGQAGRLAGGCMPPGAPFERLHSDTLVLFLFTLHAHAHKLARPPHNATQHVLQNVFGMCCLDKHSPRARELKVRDVNAALDELAAAAGTAAWAGRGGAGGAALGLGRC